MSKVFRLYKNGPDTYEGWSQTATFPYSLNNRNSIDDPDGATASREITSIPSPFARIDLVKNAFEQVVAKGLDGNTIFHKMVSDCLDIGELFFNCEKYKDKIRIITWNKNAEIDTLQNSGLAMHNLFADVFNKYWQSDSATYNLGKQNNFYLLEYIGPNAPKPLNIIGATSPATLFFSTANDLSYTSRYLMQGNDKFFDNIYTPLYKRDFKYIESLWTLKQTIPEFAILFPEVDKYLGQTFEKLNNTDKTKLRNITQVNQNDFDTIEVLTGTSKDTVEVLGYPLLKKKNIQVEKSEFTIKTDIQIICNPLPLVLPIAKGNTYSNLKYTTDKWGTENQAPYVCDEYDYKKRRLPHDGSPQAWLTISDFLQPYIIAVPHKMSASYFNGNYNDNSQKKKYSYLLPLTDRFFEFFSCEDILKKRIDGKPMIEIDPWNDMAVTVTLRIPIESKEKSFMEYTRRYFNPTDKNHLLPEVNIELDNNGFIIKREFDSFVMPMIKFQEGNNAFYRIGLVKDVDDSDMGFILYDEKNKIDSNKYTRGNNTSVQLDTYVLEKKKFDRIKISLLSDKVQGYIIPIFEEQANADRYRFAIDLGTSNTCISYIKNNETPKILDYSTKDYPLCSLFLNDDNREEFSTLYRDILPSSLSKGNLTYLPTRTAISIPRRVDWNRNIPSFALSNIDFLFGKKRQYEYNQTRTNIKWEEDVNNQKLLEMYIDNIVFLLWCKVLLNNGDINKTEIVWFYPLSMSDRRVANLRGSWNNSIKKYFGNITSKSFSESVAPAQYVINAKGGAYNVVNIDIGGGTTDIAFSNTENIKLTTSFRFASDDIYRDSFARNNVHNGIIDYFGENIVNVLNAMDELKDLKDVYTNEILSPEDKASFFFSLKHHTAMESLQIDSNRIDMDYMLKNSDDFRIIFILFYSAIIYHAINIIKSKDERLPDHINLCGNGSNNIKIITEDANILAKYTKLLFEKVLNRKLDQNIEILGLDNEVNPKELTCLGGVNVVGDIDEGKKVVLKSNNEFVDDTKDTLDIIDNEYKQLIKKSVLEFFHIVLESIPKEFDMDNKFGVSSLATDSAKEVCFNGQHIENYIDRALDILKGEDVNNTKKIPETIFFYPIKGLLGELSTKIYQTLKQQKK
ncbi:MAG: hypothetical protein IJ180_07915 [Bacteroidales bacterium]|nr:hypothetical protein [Bacteroidales bacterium]